MQTKLSFGKISGIGILYILLAACRGTAPDIVLINGKIFTADSTNRYVEAIAIAGNRIVATGGTAVIESMAGKFTQRFDLAGKTVIPGFNDAHAHVGWNAKSGNTYQYNSPTVNGPPKQSIIDSLRLLVNKSDKGEWIYGTIGLAALYDSSGFRRELLDSIAPDNPVVLQAWWGHGMIVNSEALRQLSIATDAVDPVGGWYERIKGSQQLSGAIYEYAQWPFWNALTWSDTVTFINDLKQTDRQFIEHGVTSFQQMNILQPATRALDLFKKAKLRTRCRLVSMVGSDKDGRLKPELSHTIEDTTICVSGVKYLVDGTPLDRTALLTRTYRDKRGWYGRLDFSRDTITQILREALEDDHQTLLHIVGDSTLAIVLQLMKSMQCDSDWRRKRLRIEHNSTRYITAQQMDAVKALGIVMMHTPQYGHASKLASWISMGVPVGIAPDGLVNPFVNLKTVTSEQSTLKENLTVEQAIRAYTYGNAYAEFKEGIKGSLVKGKLADLVVLSEDIFSIPPDNFVKIKSVLTMVNGQVVYTEGSLFGRPPN